MSLTFKTSRAALLPALALAKTAAPRRNTIPVLANVMVDIAAGTATFVGTNLDAELSAAVEVTHVGTGAFTVPAQMLHDIVSKLPDGAQIEVTADDRKAVVTAARSKFSLPVLPPGDFPRMKSANLPHALRLPAATLSMMLKSVGFAVSTEATRIYLNGIYLEWQSGELVATATDGHQLATIALPATDISMTGMSPIIVPREVLPLLGKFAEGDGTLAISLSDTRIAIEADSRTLASKLVDGTFPDYRRVIPTGNPNTFVLDRKDLAAALDRIMTMQVGKGNAVRAQFDDGALEISMRNMDNGEASDAITCWKIDGEPVEIGLNGKYLQDMLAATTTETVRLRMGGAGDPILIEPAGGDSQPLFVLMPMRV